jgi:hypothetical protein
MANDGCLCWAMRCLFRLQLRHEAIFGVAQAPGVIRNVSASAQRWQFRDREQRKQLTVRSHLGQARNHFLLLALLLQASLLQRVLAVCRLWRAARRARSALPGGTDRRLRLCHARLLGAVSSGADGSRMRGNPAHAREHHLLLPLVVSLRNQLGVQQLLKALELGSKVSRWICGCCRGRRSHRRRGRRTFGTVAGPTAIATTATAVLLRVHYGGGAVDRCVRSGKQR